MTIQMKANEHHFSVVLFVILYTGWFLLLTVYMKYLIVALRK